MRERILTFVREEYGTLPEYPWKDSPTSAVLRHAENRKWYGLIMNVRNSSLGLPGDGFTDVMNVKLDPMMISLLRGQEGYLPAFHMNKTSWLTLLLDGTLSEETIRNLLDQSYLLTAGKKSKAAAKRMGPKDWLVPANPKYYDLVEAFRQSEVIDWKQSSDVRVGDLVYLYAAVPYSAILYKCRAVEVDIPYHYQDENLNIKKLMKIQRLHTYPADFMPFSRMKEEFGVYAVRGPRSVPYSLKQELDAYAQEEN